jgi:FKBP-type peptidyl-prolyl cis-trans isomerase FkpA
MTGTAGFAAQRALACIGLVLLVACSNDDSPTAASGGVTELQVQELRVGTGAQATTGRTVTVRYTGWLYNSSQPENKGTQFDSNSIPFVLGAGQVIRGWDQGIVGMRVGGQRRLTIPPALAYGAAGRPPTIPPNATLIFDVELLDVR